MNVLVIIVEKNLKMTQGGDTVKNSNLCKELSRVTYSTKREARGTGMEEYDYGAGIKALHMYLKITFASLITNGAIQWVIGQQELHHSLSSI